MWFSIKTRDWKMSALFISFKIILKFSMTIKYIPEGFAYKKCLTTRILSLDIFIIFQQCVLFKLSKRSSNKNGYT